MKEIPLEEALGGFGSLADELLAGGEPVALTRDGAPVLVLLSYADYDVLVGAIQQLSLPWEGA